MELIALQPLTGEYGTVKPGQRFVKGNEHEALLLIAMGAAKSAKDEDQAAGATAEAESEVKDDKAAKARKTKEDKDANQRLTK